MELVRGQPSVAVALSRAGGTQRGRGDGGGCVPAPAVSGSCSAGWRSLLSQPPASGRTSGPVPGLGLGSPPGTTRTLPSSPPAPASSDTGDLQSLIHLRRAVRLSHIRSWVTQGTDHPNSACEAEPAAAGRLCGHQSQLGTATCAGSASPRASFPFCPSSSSSLAPLWSFLDPTLEFSALLSVSVNTAKAKALH